MTTQEIKIEALKIQGLGSKLTIEEIVAILTKSEAKKAKKMRKSAERFEQREKQEKRTPQLLWGHGCEFSTQAEYQRSCLGGKWSK